MEKQIGIPIVMGCVELERKPTPHKRVTKVKVQGIIFKNCADSKGCPTVLYRAIRALPIDLKKLNGWTIKNLIPVKQLGFSNPSIAE